jgi:hypothetical protein
VGCKCEVEGVDGWCRDGREAECSFESAWRAAASRHPVFAPVAPALCSVQRYILCTIWDAGLVCSLRRRVALPAKSRSYGGVSVAWHYGARGCASDARRRSVSGRWDSAVIGVATTCNVRPALVPRAAIVMRSPLRAAAAAAGATQRGLTLLPVSGLVDPLFLPSPVDCRAVLRAATCSMIPCLCLSAACDDVTL